MAAGGGFRDVAEVLFDQGGIDVNDVDIYGRTALDWACHEWKFVPTDSKQVSRASQVREGSLMARMGLDFPTSVYTNTVAASLCCYI